MVGRQTGWLSSFGLLFQSKGQGGKTNQSDKSMMHSAGLDSQMYLGITLCVPSNTELELNHI
jgi:hypothetical protein